MAPPTSLAEVGVTMSDYVQNSGSVGSVTPYCELYSKSQRRLSGRPLSGATRVKFGSGSSTGQTQSSAI